MTKATQQIIDRYQSGLYTRGEAITYLIGEALTISEAEQILGPDPDECDDWEGEREFMRSEARHRNLTEDEQIIYGLI